uniref:Uncharacterized protein n=1 Tax=Psilocybe cubensis TaxID=181762 RepID=A0A8H7XKM4_PSICU
MSIPTITNLNDFRAGLAKLNEKIRFGLENGNLTEIIDRHWDLVTAIATSRATNCVAEKQKSSNKFLFDFLLAYGKARQKNKHASPEFLNEMKNLLQKTENASQQSEAKAKETRARRSSERRSATSQNHTEVSHPVEQEAEASTIRSLKRHRVDDVTPSCERSPKRFHDIEAASDEDDEFIPSHNPSPSEAESDKNTPDPKRPYPKPKRAKPRARTLVSNLREKSEKPTREKSEKPTREKSEKPTHDDRPPAKATKWIHVQGCEMCVQHGRKCRVTYQMATCFYCNKHRRGCKGRSEAIERCSDVDDNESITSELEEDRKPDAKSRRGQTLKLVKVETSTPDLELSKPIADSNRREAKGKGKMLAVDPSTYSQKGEDAEMDTQSDDTKKIVRKAEVPGPTNNQPDGRAGHFSSVSIQTEDMSADKTVKTWMGWMQDDFVRTQNESVSLPLPQRPTYIRNWDGDEEGSDSRPKQDRTTEERLKTLECQTDKILERMKKIDDQLQSNDNGFDYMAGKLAFFISMVQMLDKKSDMVNNFHGEVIHRMTLLRREMNAMAHDIYISHGSEDEHHMYHDTGVQAGDIPDGNQCEMLHCIVT